MPGKRITRRLGGALASLVFAVLLANGFAWDARKPADGEALPDGALKRLGSLRWRHGEPITFLAFPSDGKTLVSAAQDGVLRLWDRETGKEIRRFVPPVDPKAKAVTWVHPYMQGVTRAAMTKDGKMLAVLLRSNMIQLWEVETGKALRQFKGPANGAGAMAFTPDGKILAVRGVTDRICFLHDTETGKELRQLKPMPPGGMGGNIGGGAGDGTGLAISPDSKFIALPELEFNNQKVTGSVTLFEIDTGKEIRRTDNLTNGISGIAFSPDGKTLVFNTHIAIHFKEVETDKEIRQVRAIQGANRIAFAPDGQSLAVKGRDNLVRLYDPKTGNVVHTLGQIPAQKGANFAVASNPNGVITTDVVYSADSKTIIIGGQQVPRFFDVATGKEQPLPGGGHLGSVAAIMASADGKTIVSRGAEGILRVWDADSGKEVRQIAEPPGTSAVLFSPGGKLVALGSNDGTVRLIDVADGKEKRQFKAHQGTIATLAFSADGQRLATRGSYDGLLKIFDVEKGAELKQITYQNTNNGNGVVVVRAVNGTEGGEPLAFSPDGKTLVTFVGSQQTFVQGQQQVQPDTNCLRFFDVAAGQEIRQIPMPAGRAIKHLVYSHDSRLLISENLDKTVTLWEVASGQERSHFGQPVALPPATNMTSFVVINGINRSGPQMSPVGTTIAQSKDGSLIALPGPNNTIKVYDVSLGKEVGSIAGHDGAIASLIFTADTKTLISGGNDTAVLIWDLARAKREPPPKVADLRAKEFDRLWADLASSDAKKAGKGLQTLIAGSNASVAHLKDRIQPATPADANKVDQWLRELDSNNFTKRAIAMRELKKLGDLAVPALKKVLAANPSLETRRRVEPLLEELTSNTFTSEQLRILRAIEVLDRVGSTEARQVLERLAEGAAGSLTTRQAQATLDRLGGDKK
jgi:WD40 repeat protein